MGIREVKNKKGISYELNMTVKENGITKRIYKTFSSRKDAKNYEAMVRSNQIETGKIYKECTFTLNQVFDEFLQIDSNRYQYNTIDTYKKKYNKYVRNSIGRAKILSVDYAMLQDFFNKLKDNGKSTNKKIKDSLSAVLTFAVKNNYIKGNPIQYVKVIGKDTTKEQEILPFEIFAEIVEELESSKSYNFHAYSFVLKLCYYTGLRISEALSLNKSDFDLKNDYITINKKLLYVGLKKEDLRVDDQTKTEASKSEVPIPEVFKEDIIQWFEENPYKKAICDEEGYYLQPHAIERAIKRIAEPLGVHYHNHMLRHTYTYNLYKNQTDLKTMQELLRHKNISTTIGIYTSIDKDHKKDSVNAVFSEKRGKNVGNRISQASILN